MVWLSIYAAVSFIIGTAYAAMQGYDNEIDPAVSGATMAIFWPIFVVALLFLLPFGVASYFGLRLKDKHEHRRL